MTTVQITTVHQFLEIVEREKRRQIVFLKGTEEVIANLEKVLLEGRQQANKQRREKAYAKGRR